VSWLLVAGAAAVGAGLLGLMVLLVPPSRVPSLGAAEAVSAYVGSRPEPVPADHPRPDARAQATGAAAQVLGRNRSLEERIRHRLETAGSRVKPAEWLLVHTAVLVGAGLVGLLAGAGNVPVFAIFLVLGVLGPWLYLGLRGSRRRKAFSAAVPDTLQLMSGSLAAGLSLAQSAATVAREGVEPVASEFRRALVETRLGVPIEDALEGIAERFDSADLAWAVMAIRIQRQVGGNLAELLDTVAATMREREYIRRQVSALSAEGRISAWVLGCLPPAFLLYLLLANREYVMVLFSDPRGWVLLAAAGLWLAVGVFWMSRLVKVEV
jgi:tight adherence protein B